MTDNTEVKESDGKEEVKIQQKSATVFSGIINLMNTIIGAGVLGLPYAFARAGVVPAILIFILMILYTFCSFSHLVYVSDATLVYSYGDV